jgi:hypothetical protein
MIISLIKLIWPYKSSLTLPLFIEVPVPSHESEQLCQGSTLTFWPTCPFGQVPYWFYLPVQLSYSCLELRLDRIWWYSPGCLVGVLMSVGVMTVGVLSVGEITVGIMTVGVMRQTSVRSLIWMRFGTSDHIFNIHDVQLIIIFISLTNIKDIVENLDELCFQCSCASMFT